MYAHSQSMNIPHQIDDVPVGGGDEEDASGAPDSMDQHQLHNIGYDDAAAAAVVVVDDMSADSVYVSSSGGPGSELLLQGGDITNQLTLTFRGQVYVFDDVTPDKVQAVLLLLGGCEINSGLNGLEMLPQGQRGTSMDYPGRSTQPHRAASLNRFRQKRKERCFDKKVRYSVRQEVAQRMQRNKGQFTSSKKDGAYGWDGSQDSGHDDSQQETSCTHCGISSKSTPMMRRGPSGPRSLCNACGLFWANRGTLRDLSKRNQDHASSAPVEQSQVEAEANMLGSGGAGTHMNNELVVYSNGDESGLISGEP
ncbi:unnamed protein product [Linum trigynum]|uniref:GATA transcription factor 25 n=1 Tax=Linum trigynum TaxID=586398 RepID=A0AAV2FB47_9ROSI